MYIVSVSGGAVDREVITVSTELYWFMLTAVKGVLWATERRQSTWHLVSPNGAHGFMFALIVLWIMV